MVRMPTPVWHPDSLAARRPFLDRRARLTQETRQFFLCRGYTEVETPISGPLTADRLAELAGQSGALGGADVGALLRAAGFRGAFIRLSRSGDGSLAVEQMVLEFDSSAPSGRDFADGLA